MIQYIGVRLESGCRVWRIDEQGKIRALQQSKRSPNFPTDQWEWGYGGSGPANLAWALCYDASGDKEQTFATFQGVKWQIVSMLNKDYWRLTDREISDAMDRVGQGQLVDPDDAVLDIGLTNAPPDIHHVPPDLIGPTAGD